MLEQAKGSPVIKVTADGSFGPHGVSFEVQPKEKK